MPNMKLFLDLIARSEKFQQGFQQGEKALRSFRTHVQNTAQKVQQLTANVGVLGQAATALSTGLVLKKIFSISDYMPIDDALLRMRVNLKANSAEMDVFKNKIASLSGKTGLDIGQAFQGANKLSLMFPKQDEILQVMKTSDKVAKTLKEPYDIVQDRITGIMKICRLGIKDVEGIGNALIAAQVNMESLDTVMQRLALHGGAKKSYIEEMGMLRGLGIAGMNNPRVFLQLNNILNAINDHPDMMKASGIKTEGRSQIEILKDLEIYMEKHRKKMSSVKYDEAVNKFFGPNGRQDLDFIFSQLDNLKKGTEEIGHASEIAAKRSAAAEETWENQLNRIKAITGGIKTDLSSIYNLAKNPVKFMADHENLTKAAGYTAAGVSAAVLAGLGYGGIKKVFSGVGKTGLGVAKGKVLEEVTGVTPVFVVNMPAGGIMGSDIPGKTGLLTKTGALSIPALAGAAAYLFYKYPGLSGTHSLWDKGINKFSPAQDKLLNETTQWGKEHYQDKAFSIYNDEYKRGGDKKQFVFNFKFDKNGRVIGDTNTADGDFLINVARGDFFGI